MATTFMLIGMLLRLQGIASVWRGRRWYACAALAAACAPLAGLCKETGFMLPIVLAWMGFVFSHRALPMLDLLWAMVLFSVRTWYVGGTEVGFSFVDTPVRYADKIVTRGLSYLYHHAYYAQLMLLPWNLSWDYSYDALPLIDSWE